MRRWSRLFLIVFLLIGVILLLCSGALAEDKALWPQTGKNVKKSRKLILDVSYTQDGYFMAAVQKQNKHKLKLRVTKGRETLTYEDQSDGQTFPGRRRFPSSQPIRELYPAFRGGGGGEQAV